MVCIQVPIREMSCPLKKSWKLRWRKARRVAGSHTAFCADCPEFTDNHPIDPPEVPESVAFSLAVLTACPQLLETVSGGVTQNWKLSWL